MVPFGEIPFVRELSLMAVAGILEDLHNGFGNRQKKLDAEQELDQLLFANMGDLWIPEPTQMATRQVKECLTPCLENC